MENERAYHDNEMASLRLEIKETRIKSARNVLIGAGVGASVMTAIIAVFKYVID